MKILFVSGNLCDGGAQRVIAVISAKLSEMGHEVSLLLFSRNEKEYPIGEKVNVLSLGGNFEEYSKLSEIERIKRIRAFLKEIKPDVAVGFLEGGYGLYLSSWGMKFKKVASARIDPTKFIGSKGVRAKINLRWFASADAVILQTSKQKEHVSNLKWKNKTVIANPISQAAIEYPEHDYERECKKIVMAGRLSEQKNYKMVLEAMKSVHKEYPCVTLDIFGKGNQEKELQDIIHQNDMSEYVFLKGWSQNVLEEYSKSDLYILASDFEGMPNALMEAMGVGLPCISTDCDTGPEDLIEDGKNGFLIPVGDTEKLTNKIIDVLSMTTDERRRIGIAAHDTMKEKFNADIIAKKWEDLFYKLLDKEFSK